MVTFIQKLQPWIGPSTPTARGGFVNGIRRTVEVLGRAVGAGDLRGLLDFLAPDVVPLADGGGNCEWGSFTDPGSTARLGRRRTRAEGCLARRSVRGGPPEFGKADCRERYAVQRVINRLKGHCGTAMSRLATANRSSTTK
ncbi:hypothetical protein [Streptomyces atratus]|uniref:hypothetical protein n=1 Tax=Streptomyces atratus TaxID=1893 RepID=UPI0021A33006|nr:hypothetical protein [Streptomyces atratus]MCT2546737.1 hypothetical protein [Streptomyces atratus]